MAITKGKFKIGVLFNFIFVGAIASLGSLAFIVKALRLSNEKELSTTIIILLLMGFLFICSILLLNMYKYIKIDSTKKYIKYHSLLNSFGKIIAFDESISYIKSSEITFDGAIDTIHLVNQNSYTFFKINISHYKNAYAIYKAIPLKEIKKYKFGNYAYLKLIFTGRIKVYDKGRKTE